MSKCKSLEVPQNFDMIKAMALRYIYWTKILAFVALYALKVFKFN